MLPLRLWVVTVTGGCGWSVTVTSGNVLPLLFINTGGSVIVTGVSVLPLLFIVTGRSVTVTGDVGGVLLHQIHDN